MKVQNELAGRMVGKDGSGFSPVCGASVSDCSTALVKPKKLDEPEPAGAHWSGQPGEDLFFNSWKLLF